VCCVNIGRFWRKIHYSRLNDASSPTSLLPQIIFGKPSPKWTLAYVPLISTHDDIFSDTYMPLVSARDDIFSDIYTPLISTRDDIFSDTYVPLVSARAVIFSDICTPLV